MKAVHFGAGNIGRGFIGEILAANGFEILFVDIDPKVINALKQRKSYMIERADETKKQLQIQHVSGVNNQSEPEKVIKAIKEADLVTTAIGPVILPHIAELIAKGIDQRQEANNTQKLDVIACENMIGGSTFLKKEVEKYCRYPDYLSAMIGFPDAAVDRIVPLQKHEDPLFVQVEPFCEWVIQEEMVKSSIRLNGVKYVKDLEPYCLTPP